MDSQRQGAQGGVVRFAGRFYSRDKLKPRELEIADAERAAAAAAFKPSEGDQAALDESRRRNGHPDMSGLF